MAIKVIVENHLSGLWATDEDFASMSDGDIVRLIDEDIVEFLDGAAWTIVREPDVGGGT